MSHRLLLVLLCAVVLSMPRAQVTAAGSGLPIDVIHYDARIEPDLAAKTIQGAVAITFAARGERREWIELDRGDLTIDSVRDRGAPQELTDDTQHRAR